MSKTKDNKSIKYMSINDLNHWEWSHINVLLTKGIQATYQIRNLNYGEEKKGEKTKIRTPIEHKLFLKNEWKNT
jgi:hypothetical protein